MGKIYWSTAIVWSLLILSIHPVSAEPEDKLKGKVSIGIMVIDSGNNLNPRGSKKYLKDLNSAAGKELTTLPLLLPEASYDVGDPDGLKMYFNTVPPIDEVGGFAFNIGGNYPLPGIGILDISTFFTPFEEAWKNPYVTGVERQTTSTSKYGAKVALNRIMGTGLRINIALMNDDVDDDLVGTIIPDMARDGAVYALNTNYSFNLSKSFELRPRLSLRKGEYDGESNSFTKYKFDLEARYMTGRLMVMPKMYYSYSEYDKTNPVFDKTQENNGYGVNVMINFMAPFGLENWSAQGLLGYSKGDSNIDFYDTEAINLGAFMSYRF